MERIFYKYAQSSELHREVSIHANDMKLGGLAAIYRHVGHNAKVGVGLNASRFSDNLVDPEKNEHGWFLNVISKF